MANETIAGLQNALGHGAHTNKFYVTVSPTAADSTLGFTAEDSYLAKAASYPEKSIGIIRVSKQGRELRLPGETSFPDNYTITFYMTKGHELRQKMINWMTQMDDFKNNRHTLTPEQYMATITISQLAPSETPATSPSNENLAQATYTMYNCFPSSVGEVRVDTATNNEILVFDVTYTMTYWV